MNKSQFLDIMNKPMGMQEIYNLCASYAVEHDKELSPDLFNKVNNNISVNPNGTATSGNQLVMEALNLSVDYFKSKFEVTALTKNNKVIKYY